MSELDPKYSSIYGGEMTGEELYDAEFRVSEEMPEWVESDVAGIQATLKGEEIFLSRLNTKIYDINPMSTTIYGVDIDLEFIGFDHIYIYRGEDKPPFWYMRPEEDEEGQQAWDELAVRLIDIDCDYICAAPKTLDFENSYEIRRGDEPMDDILERILEE